MSNMDTIQIDFKYLPDWADIEPIVPASNALPTWYKDASPMVDTDSGAHGTFKSCPAILDSMMQGYILPLWADIWVEPSSQFINGKPIPSFSLTSQRDMEWGMIRFHPVEMTQEMPSIASLDMPISLKLDSPWMVRTPENYSMLYLPPLNNKDSRFEAVSGVVCTDEYVSFINLPLMWTAPPDYRGLIKKGTPLAQLIPFKREIFQQELGCITQEEFDATVDYSNALSRDREIVEGMGVYKQLWHPTARSR